MESLLLPVCFPGGPAVQDLRCIPGVVPDATCRAGGGGKGGATDACRRMLYECASESKQRQAGACRRMLYACASNDGHLRHHHRGRPAEACRRMLYVCVFATSVTAHHIAHYVLTHSYKRASRRRLDVDEIILPLVQRFCGVPDWLRCTNTCRVVRRRLGLTEAAEREAAAAGAGAKEPWAVGAPDEMGALEALLALDAPAPDAPASAPALSRAACWLGEFSRQGQEEVFRLVVQHNVPALLRPLARARADLNCTFEQFWFRTPLHRAASRGHSEVCRLLLALAANPQPRDSHGAAPVHLVASKGRVHIVDLLLQHDPAGADAMDHSGRTPCHVAALKGHLGAVRWLVAVRADPEATASDGRTPLDMAVRAQHTEIASFLEGRLRHRREDVPAARHLLGSLFRRSLGGLGQGWNDLQEPARRRTLGGGDGPGWNDPGAV